MVIKAEDIKELLNQLVEKKISREKAATIALELKKNWEGNSLLFYPETYENKIWDAIVNIESFAEKIDKDTYLYSEDFLINYIKENAWNSEHWKTVIEVKDIKELFIKLIEKKFNREQAATVTTKLMEKADANLLEYYPEELEDKIWDAILFIDVFAVKTDVNTYLYSDEDLIIYIQENSWDIEE